MLHHWTGDGDGRDRIGSADADVLDGAAFTGPVAGKGRHTDEAFVIDHFDGRWRGFIRDELRRSIQIRSDPFTLGRWTHLALTWDGSTVTFYVDGESVGRGLSATINSTDSFFAIGYRNEEGFTDAELDFEFEGATDDVAYANRPLTSDEIAAVFEAGADGICRG